MIQSSRPLHFSEATSNTGSPYASLRGRQEVNSYSETILKLIDPYHCAHNLPEVRTAYDEVACYVYFDTQEIMG